MYDHTKNFVRYPRYMIKTMEVIPEKNKEKYYEKVIEIIKASSENLNAGSYSDVSGTIETAHEIAKKMYTVKVVGMIKEISDNSEDDIFLTKDEMSEEEKKIFKATLKTRL